MVDHSRFVGSSTCSVVNWCSGQLVNCLLVTSDCCKILTVMTLVAD